MAADEAQESLAAMRAQLEVEKPRIKWANRIESRRVCLESTVPTRPYAHDLPRRLSLPLDLLAAAGGLVDAETIAEWRLEASGEDEPPEEDEAEEQVEEEEEVEEEEVAVISAPRRRKSMIESVVDLQCRELRVATALLAELEAADEAQLPRKLTRQWKVAHGGWALDLTTAPSLQADDFALLGFALRFNYPFRSLNLAGRFVQDADLVALARAIRWNYVLERLDVSQAKLTDGCLGALEAVLLGENSTLTELDLRLNKISLEGGAQLARLARGSLRVLNGIILAEITERPTALALQGRSLRLPEVVLLRELLLRGQSRLERLDLSGNDLGPEAVAVLAETTVPSHGRLLMLKLNDTKMGPAGLLALAAMLATNASLTALEVARNGLAQERSGVAELLKVLRWTNKTLTAVDYTDNDLSDADIGELEARLSVNRALTHTPDSFVTMLDGHFDTAARSSDGGYEITMALDDAYIRHERCHREPPIVDFGFENDDFNLRPAPRRRVDYHHAPLTK